MKKLKHICNAIIWIALGAYALLIILLHIPSIQRTIASEASSAIGRKLNTSVQIGRVDLGFLNRLIADDVVIKDQQGKDMLKAARLSVKISLYQLIKGRVSISSIQMFGIKGNFYRQDEASPANYQFALDAIASEDTTQTALDININSLIIRHGSISYHRHDIAPTHGTFNAGHIDIKDISTHIILPYLTNDSTMLQVKKMSMKEASGLDLRNLSFKFKADRRNATLSELELRFPATVLNSDMITARYECDDKGRITSLIYDGSISSPKLTLSDAAFLLARLKTASMPIALSAAFSGTEKTLQVHSLKASSGSDLNILASAWLDNSGNGAKWKADISKLYAKTEALAQLSGSTLPAAIANLGYIDFSGDANGTPQDMHAGGTLKTGAGQAVMNIDKQAHRYSGHIRTDGLALGNILNDSRFGSIIADLDVNGNETDGRFHDITAKGEIARFEYNSYPFSNIHASGTLDNGILDGSVTMDDPNGNVNISGNIGIGNKRFARLTAQARDLKPQAMNLTGRWGDAAFSGNISADLSGGSADDIAGQLDITGFSMKSAKTGYYLEQLHIEAINANKEKTINISSDFADATISGKFDFSTISQSIANLTGSKLPTLPGLPQAKNNCGNNVAICATIHKSDWANALLGIPLHISSPVNIHGSIDDDSRTVDIAADAPLFSYDGSEYQNASLLLKTDKDLVSAFSDTLQAKAFVRKVMGNGHKLDIDISASATNNRLATTVSWDNHRRHPMKGIINTTAEFSKDIHGKPATHLQIHPSEIHVNDTVWNISPADIRYSDKRLLVDNFAIRHNKQYIKISGMATDSEEDSLTVSLSDVDVKYILDLVNFHSVEFSGKASGKACVKSAFGTPDAHTYLTVSDFRFQKGRMGTLHAKARWNDKDSQIDIDAYTDDGPGSTTTINGYVSPERNYIDLGIGAHNTRLEFLESFCGSFMRNVEAHANGATRLFGDLSKINLTGQLVADGTLDISTLNTTYRLESDTITLVPNEIIFKNDIVRDINGNTGVVNGQLHHKYLTRLTYDLRIDANNLLAYDFKDYGNNTFYGTIRATGTCAIRGRSGRIDFDIDAKPEGDSFIEYNAASPDAISSQDFIEWRDATAHNGGDSESGDSESGDDNDIDRPSDIYINFTINANPDFTLRLLMDQKSGDRIKLNGNGMLRATYYNKGSFNMYGNYLIDHGSYDMTIQNFMSRNFTFTRGGSIVFGGDPYSATLDLKALYTVNGVPLSDLQIGKSFSSNNVRVDCLMNISGTPASPQVSFDLDLPTVNTDAKQMIRSLINSEEEMNQQVIYLLSIGRFYLEDRNNETENGEQQSQTSLAMQSLLSGTISQQVSKVLSSFIKNNNWNFGANISTGNEGWNNAEYEGLLSGKLLNNRLLLNGQFGYRDNKNATTSFIGDFDIRYLLYPNGNLAIKMYNQTNDRYFTKSSLNTQGIGLIMKKDFNSWADLFRTSKAKKAKPRAKKRQAQE